MLGPKFVQRFAFEWSVCDDALRFQSIDNLPRFADVNVWRQFFTELGFEPASAPHPLHENRLETNRLGKIALAHAAISGTVAAAVSAALFSSQARTPATTAMNLSRFLKYWLPVLVWLAVIF